VPGLKALFTQWEAANGLPADTLNYVGVGTGAALTTPRNRRGGRRHHHGRRSRRRSSRRLLLRGRPPAIFYSDYVIPRPLSDPAGVLTGARHDAVSAFEKIAAARRRGRRDVRLARRQLGTNVEEQQIWG